MLNVNKTYIMVFQKRSIKHNVQPVYLDDKIIQRIESIKFLGLEVDENLN